MKKTIKYVLAAILLLCGCQNINTSKITPPYKASLYTRGKEIKTIDIPANSDIEKQITSFLKNNQTRWKPSFVTYAPGLMVYGDNFKLLLDDVGPVLNYCPEKNKSFQGTKSNSPEMQKFKNDLLNLIKQTP